MPTEHISDVATAIYAADSQLPAHWAKQHHGDLDAGKLDAALAALRRHATANDEARGWVAYIDRNRARMRHPEFPAQSLCTSTGAVAAG